MGVLISDTGAAFWVSLAAHAGLGLAVGVLVGIFGRTVLGLVVAVAAACLFAGAGEECVAYVSRWAGQVPTGEVAAFVRTGSGLAALAAFSLGLYVSVRGLHR